MSDEDKSRDEQLLLKEMAARALNELAALRKDMDQVKTSLKARESRVYRESAATAETGGQSNSQILNAFDKELQTGDREFGRATRGLEDRMKAQLSLWGRITGSESARTVVRREAEDERQ